MIIRPAICSAVAFLTAIASSLPCEAAREVRYSDFGAKGDGKTDDFEALVKAHEHANEKGLPVKADGGATYYIGGAANTIRLMTDTDFGSAAFIIDDTNLESHRQHVFEVASKHKAIRLQGVETLSKGQERIRARLPGPCVITAYNSKIKRFIRRGNNQNNGRSQTDVFLVDRTGKVDPNTPIIWDFEHISKIEAMPLDEEILTIRGGRFTTLACSKVSTDYHRRGIMIQRSNVIVEGLEHRIKGEGKDGPPYHGFISISKCANVQIRDCQVSGHKTYYKVGNAGRRTPMGSYDISLTSALNVSLIRCTQINDIMDRSLWGIMGTNFCKNLILDGCKLSRFDAHMGVTNATIRNSTLGYMGIKLTGFGVCTIENTTVKAPDFIGLRPDYGSTWDGEVIIRDCVFEPMGKRSSLGIIAGSNDGTHDFGYTTHLPNRVVIDKLHIADGKQGKGYKGPSIFGDINPKMKNASYQQAHPQVITKQVAYRGVTTDSNKPLRLSDNEYLFRDVEVHAGE